KQKRPLDRTTLHLMMKKYGAAAGIPAHLQHFQVLKHYCATPLLSKGFGVERVQNWIGHANIQSTMEYAKVTNARRDARIATGDAPHGWSSNTLSFREGT